MWHLTVELNRIVLFCSFRTQRWSHNFADLNYLLLSPTVCMYVCMYYNHGRSTSRVAITVQSQGQVKTDMQGQVTVITHMIQRSLTCRYPIYIENTTTYDIYLQRAAFGRCPVLALAT